MDIAVRGLAPYLPGPGRAPRWWIATGRHTAERLGLTELYEQAEPPQPADGACVCGLAAPCSLPHAFVEHLGLGGERDQVLRTLESPTTKRLLRQARAFAAGRPHGQRHPLRTPKESTSALARHRLPLFKAALPLLRAARALPWTPQEPPYVVEVDVPCFLAGLGLPSTRLAGALPQALERRMQVLDALSSGGAGFALESPREPAVTSFPALAAVVAAAAAAWAHRNPPAPSVPAPDAWFPCP
ncbi:MAG: hypothetical protein ACE10D_11875 [Planctomycetota bacterium]